MKLWLDDLREMPPGFDLHVKTAAAAIIFLETGEVTKISFDHDLGPDGIEYTGYYVALWIEMAAHTGRIPPLEWVVHSANPPGRKNIEMAMRKADAYWEEKR